MPHMLVHAPFSTMLAGNLEWEDNETNDARISLFNMIATNVSPPPDRRA